MKCSELLRKLLGAGWIEVRQSGSHKILEKDGKQIVFPDHGTKEMAKGTESKIRKQAGLK